MNTNHEQMDDMADFSASRHNRIPRATRSGLDYQGRHRDQADGEPEVLHLLSTFQIALILVVALLLVVVGATL